MDARSVRLSDKTISAPFAAFEITVHRVTRFRPQDFYDFVAVIGGSGRHVSYAGGGRPRSVPVAAGDMVVFRPVDEVMLEALDPQGLLVQNVAVPAAEWAIFADLAGIDGAWAHAMDPPTASFEPGPTGDFRPFTDAIDRFHDAPTSYDLVRFLMDVVPTLLPDARDRRVGVGAPAWLQAAIMAMREESALRLGLPHLLQLAHVSAAHLAGTVGRFYDVTPTALVLELRLRHAAVLLTTTGSSIGKIAERCGFKTFAYFSTAFRRKYGVSPRAYRQRSLRQPVGKTRQ
jgi:AraC-like DNA-binding protein